MKKLQFLFLFVIFSCSDEINFGNNNTFLKVFGKKSGISPRTIRSMPNGGYATVGFDFLESFTTDDKSGPNRIKPGPSLVVFDQFGNQKWTRSYPVERGTLRCHQAYRNEVLSLNEDSVFFRFFFTQFNDVVPLNNGGFVILGWHRFIGSLSDPPIIFNGPFSFSPFVLVVDSQGKIERRLEFDCNEEFRVYVRMVDLKDGRIALRSSRTDFFESFDRGYGHSVAMIDYEGNLLWEDDYGRETALIGTKTGSSDFSATPNELVIVGTIVDNDTSAFIRKINPSNGDIIAESIELTDGNNHKGFNVVSLNTDEGYALSQVVRPIDDKSQGYRVVVSLFDKGLNRIRSFSATDPEVTPNGDVMKLINTADGNLVIQAALFDPIVEPNVFDLGSFNNDVFLWKTDLEGNLLWKIPDPVNTKSIPRNLVATSDGGFVGLRFGPFGTQGFRGYLFKANVDGKISK